MSEQYPEGVPADESGKVVEAGNQGDVQGVPAADSDTEVNPGAQAPTDPAQGEPVQPVEEQSTSSAQAASDLAAYVARFAQEAEAYLGRETIAAEHAVESGLHQAIADAENVIARIKTEAGL